MSARVATALALALPLLGGCGWFGAAPGGDAAKGALPLGPDGRALPSPIGPAAAPLPPVGSGDVLYAFTVHSGAGAADRVAGTRVFTDGRVEVTTGGQVGASEASPGDWRHDRVLAPERVAELRQALAADAIAKLPREIKGDPAATDRGPRAVWQLRVGEDLRTIEALHYTGVRVPALESLHKLLAAEVDGEAAVSTDWRLAREGHTLTALVPCHPAQTRALKGLTHLLLDPTATPLDAAPPEDGSPDLATVTWREASLAWVTRLRPDGVVLRGRPNGTVVAVRLPPERLQAARAALDAVDWANSKHFCDQRLTPGATGAEPGSLKGALPPGARLAPKGAAPPPVASPDEPATPR
jgi:hypothetical protein